jgi:hypothetical protein
MNDIKNIQTIAPMLADDFIDLEEPIFDTDKYSEFLLDRKNKLGLFSKYLVCKFHDSWVIDVKQTDDLFSITLNDFSTYVFADAIIEKFSLPIDSDHISFPISLNFNSNLSVTYNTVDDDGNLKQIPPTKLDEYLYEQVITADTDKIEVVFHFWQSHKDKPGERIIVIVSAKDLTITENQDGAFHKLFGNKYDNYYNYFKQQFDSDRYVSDGHVCSELIDELDKSTTR